MAIVDDDYEGDDSDLPAASEAHMEIEKSVLIDLQKRSAFLPSFPWPLSTVLIPPLSLSQSPEITWLHPSLALTLWWDLL